jgi:enamine deaminase RidA (YjgF/YER057c/UK114 family)
MVARPSEGLKRLGLSLPPPPKPQGSYAPAVRLGDQVFVSGQGAMREGQPLYHGPVEAEVSLREAQEAARIATLQGLSAASALLGSVDKIRRAIRVVVYVASSPGFTRQHEVGNGATELLVELLGEEGRPARVSVGVTALPLDFPVEVELLLLAD